MHERSRLFTDDRYKKAIQAWMGFYHLLRKVKLDPFLSISLNTEECSTSNLSLGSACNAFSQHAYLLSTGRGGGSRVHNFEFEFYELITLTFTV